MSPQAKEAQDRKVQLLKTWETAPLKELSGWVNRLSEEEMTLLVEAVQEKEAAEAAR